jgi:LysM repeat protein
MNYKIQLIITPLLALSYPLFARTASDSIGVENLNRKKVILHKLDPKDNFYSIGRRYNVKPAIIMEFNKNIKMSIGNIIKVPTDLPFNQPGTITATKPPAAPVSQPNTNTQASANAGVNGSATEYKISAGETLFAISRRFGTTVDDIMQLNGLKSNNLVPGQILLVRAGTPAPKPPVVVQTTPVAPSPVVGHHDDTTQVMKRDSTFVAKSDSSTGRRPGTNRFGLFEKDEKGVATWIDDASLDPNKKLVLHRTAPVGTVIKITNPMTNRTTFAKVVGRFTDSEATKDVIIVMTKNTADSIGALDKRFRVIISYGTTNE